MTYEEFRALALNPPKPQGVDSFFELKAYMSANLPDHKRQHYPQYDLWVTQASIFQTLEEAEKAIHALVVGNPMEEDDDKYYSFMVTERQFSTPSHLDCGVLSWRLYDGNGELALQSLAVSDHCEVDERYKKFRGRTEDTIKFKKGDIVEVADYHRKKVRLAVVIGTPLDIDWCWDYRQRIPASKLFEGTSDNDEDIEAFYGICSMDDSYTIIDGPGPEWHCHVPSYCISSPRYPVPPYMQKKLRHNYQRYLEKSTEYEKKIQ